MRASVTESGDPASMCAYVRSDWDVLSGADFFDYNHLNQDGIDKYNRMLAEALRPHAAADHST
jgi:hypothetical protein